MKNNSAWGTFFTVCAVIIGAVGFIALMGAVASLGTSSPSSAVQPIQPSPNEQQPVQRTANNNSSTPPASNAQDENLSPTSTIEPVAVTVEPTSSGMLDGGNFPSSGSFVLAPSSQVLRAMDAILNDSQTDNYPEASFIANALPIGSICGFEIGYTSPGTVSLNPLIEYFLSHASWVKLTATYSPAGTDITQYYDNTEWPHEHLEVTSDVPFSEWFAGYVAQAGFTSSVQANEACLDDPSQRLYFFDGTHTDTAKFTAPSSKPYITSVNPTSGSTGTPVTITGSGFAIDSLNNISIQETEVNEDSDAYLPSDTVTVEALSPDGHTLSFTMPSVPQVYVEPPTYPVDISVSNTAGGSNQTSFLMQ